MANSPRKWEVASGRSSWDGFSHFLLASFPLSLLIAIIPVMLLVHPVSGRPRLFGSLSIGLSVTGFVFFSIAKFSMFQRGVWMSFGSSSMTTRNRMFYRLGYTLMICAAFIALAILAVGKQGLL